jgi:hypothetical protein
LLRSEHQRLLQVGLDGIHFSQLAPPKTQSEPPDPDQSDPNPSPTDPQTQETDDDCSQ